LQPGRRAALDLSAEREVEDDDHGADGGAPEQQRAVCTDFRESRRVGEPRWHPGEECPQRVAQVLEHRVPRNHLRSLGRLRRAWQRGDLEDQRGAAVAAHPVHHAEESGHGEGQRARAQREGCRTCDAERCDRDQKTPSAEPVCCERRDQCSQRGTSNAARQHRAELGAAQIEAREIAAERDSDRTRSNRAEKCHGVQEPSIAVRALHD
jgi:hypothetical protein